MTKRKKGTRRKTVNKEPKKRGYEYYGIHDAQLDRARNIGLGVTIVLTSLAAAACLSGSASTSLEAFANPADRKAAANAIASPLELSEGTRLLGNVTCAWNRKSVRNRVAGCHPEKCARFVLDDIVTREEAGRLENIFDRALSLTAEQVNEGGPVQVLDFASGALSRGNGFIVIHDAWDSRLDIEPWQRAELDFYLEVVERMKTRIREIYGLRDTKLWQTKPAFYSQMRADIPALKINDEYWHSHVDTEQYPASAITVLIYLSDHGSDFTGGEFQFEDGTVLEPQKGRVVLFTSGAENPHHVNKMKTGVRRAMTMLFTCKRKNELDLSWMKSYS